MKTVLVLSVVLFFQTQAFAVEKQIVNLEVTTQGFTPKSIDVKPNTPVVLRITRKTDATCSTSIQIPDRKITMELPLNRSVDIDLGTLKKGQIRFGCGMDMMDGGQILVK